MTLQARLGEKFTVLFENEGTDSEHFHCQVRKGGQLPVSRTLTFAPGVAPDVAIRDGRVHGLWP